ncbi:dihydroceramidase [Penicillium macrosclerotiorum]|uniref:dihydroceramidase n=1 Tax=Penicillium macrosclerotiorum TaxID=303699 RepID=UPI002547356C|nr:dihydroceramidase [Penicillium macrosclerotiorum]KAJ5678693.1 dihydroceramidase [Penicillium macrosclerotiorum]
MGHHNIHYYGDRNALNGMWSPPTSKANFCEEDYAISAYLTEFINSLTNLAYVFLALRYMYGPGSLGLFAPKVDFMAVSLFMLGVGSFLFHASMRQIMQFADELAMLGLAWSLLLGSLNVQRTSGYNRLVRVGLAVVFPLFSAFYIWTANILYHYIAFGTVLALITLRGHYLFHWRVPGFPAQKCAEWRVRSRRALILLLVGYGLWNVDLEFCTELRLLRAKMGLPWAWILELHGWWHVLTAISADITMAIVREVQAELSSDAEDKADNEDKTK